MMKLSIFLASSCVLLPLLTFSSTSSAFFGDLSCEFESGYELPKGVSSIYPCDKLGCVDNYRKWIIVAAK